MKLTKEDIGKEVIHPSTMKGVILAIDGNFMWIRESGGSYRSEDIGNTYWAIVEEPKKPTARIQEIYRQLCGDDRVPISLELAAIAKYLDEHFEASKK